MRLRLLVGDGHFGALVPGRADSEALELIIDLLDAAFVFGALVVFAACAGLFESGIVQVGD